MTSVRIGRSYFDVGCLEDLMLPLFSL